MRRLVLSIALLQACLLDAAEDFPRGAQALCANAPACPEGMVRAVDDERHTHTKGQLSIEGGTCFCIDAYEASPGPDGAAVSAADQPPWTGLTFDQAEAACEAAGKRLCSGREWTSACLGLPAMRFPYGPEFQRDRCNSEGAVKPTGAMASCEGGVPGLFDMSGNVAEWVGAPEDSGSCGAPGCAAFGGSVEFGMPDLACGLRAGFSRTSTAATIGFRCCLFMP